MARRKKSNKQKRPIAVTIIAIAIVILFFIRLYQVLEPLVTGHILEGGLSGNLIEDWSLTPLGYALGSSLTYLFLSLSGIIVLIGFLRLRRWSWVILMAWTGGSLLITLINYFYSNPNYIVMASNLVIAYALNMTDVQRIFHIREVPDEIES